jgi:protein gp37
MRANNPNEKVKVRNEGLTEKGCFNGQVRLNHEFLDLPLRVKKPTVFAVWNDLFHEDVPFDFIDHAFAFMALCPQHTFLVLTKRPERMSEYISISGRYDAIIKQLNRGYVWELPSRTVLRLAVNAPRSDKWPLPNIWLGTTAENQQTADKRIPILLQTPAAVRFVSCEPMLGPVDLNRIEGENYFIHALDGMVYWFGGGRENPKLDWVICGGESGHKARPLHPDWARSLRDQCQAAVVPFFFKQIGEWQPFYDRDIDDPDWQHIPGEASNVRRLNLKGGCGFHGDRLIYFKRVGKKNAGRELDGRTWNEFPGGKLGG